MTDSAAGPSARRFASLSMPLDERLALALAEDCGTALDEADIAYVVEAVLPVARRYGARMMQEDK